MERGRGRAGGDGEGVCGGGGWSPRSRGGHSSSLFSPLGPKESLRFPLYSHDGKRFFVVLPFLLFLDESMRGQASFPPPRKQRARPDHEQHRFAHSFVVTCPRVCVTSSCVTWSTSAPDSQKPLPCARRTVSRSLSASSFDVPKSTSPPHSRRLLPPPQYLLLLTTQNLHITAQHHACVWRGGGEGGGPTLFPFVAACDYHMRRHFREDHGSPVLVRRYARLPILLVPRRVRDY